MGLFTSKKDKLILSLNSDISELKIKLEEKECENSHLNECLSNIYALKYEDKLRDKEDEIYDLNKTISTLKTNIKSRDIAISNLTNQLKGVEELERLIKILRDDIQAKKTTISNLEENVATLENDIIFLNKEIMSISSISNDITSAKSNDKNSITISDNVNSYLDPLSKSNILTNFTYFICNILRENKVSILDKTSIKDYIDVYKGLLLDTNAFYLHPNRYNTLVIGSNYVGVDSALLEAYLSYHKCKYSISELNDLLALLIPNLDLILSYYKSIDRLNSLSEFKSEAYYTDASFEELNVLQKQYDDLLDKYNSLLDECTSLNEFKDKFSRSKTLTDVDISKIENLKKSGLSYRDISKEVGVSIYTISKVLNGNYK